MLEDTFVEITRMENSSARLTSKAATFFVNYFKEHSSTLILEYRVLGEMKHPANYFIGNQDTTLKSVSDVSFETAFIEDTGGLDFEKFDDMLPKLTLECELNYKDILIKAKFFSLDALLVPNMIQQLLYLKKVRKQP